MEEKMSIGQLPPAIYYIYQNRSMHDLDFFAMTGCLDWSRQGNDDLVLEPLIAYLAKWPDEVIYVFEDKMAELLYKLDRPEIARRAYRTDRHFSGDDFLYVRCAALVNGRAYYNKILDGRKKLNKDMEFEALLYVPAKAWARKHHKNPSEYPHMANPCYETGSNEGCWRKENLWTEYKLPFGWQIAVPDGWKQEQGENGENVFYPPQGQLTVRITPFHAEKSGKPASAKAMEQAFLQSIPPEAAQIKRDGYNLPGFRCRFFEYMENEKKDQICHVYAGYFAKGELLSINIYGESKDECTEVMKILETLQCSS